MGSVSDMIFTFQELMVFLIDSGCGKERSLVCSSFDIFVLKTYGVI